MTIPPVPDLPPLSPIAVERAVPPSSSRRRRSWWRRNGLALLAVALLIPALVVVIGGQVWHDYAGFGARPITPVLAEKDADLDLGGATWGPVRVQAIDDVSGLNTPPNSRVVAAVVPVAPGAEGVRCDPPTLVEQSTGREWKPVRFEIGLEYNADEPDSCDPTNTLPYQLVVAFVVPEDAAGPFWLDVWPSGDAPFARFPAEI